MQAAKVPTGGKPSDIREIRTHRGAFSDGNDDIEVEIDDSDKLCRMPGENRQRPFALNRTTADALAAVTLFARRAFLSVRCGRSVLVAAAAAALFRIANRRRAKRTGTANQRARQHHDSEK